MLLLTSTSDKIQVITASAGTIEVHASYMDNNAGTITPGRNNPPVISGIATTDVVASPGASVQRNVKMLSVKNDHATVSNLIEVIHTDGTNVITIWEGTLLAQEMVVLDQSGDWTYYDAAGGVKTSAIPGTLLLTTVKTSGTTHTVGPRTNSIRIRLVGGGAGGGNATGNATQSAVGGGGGAGGYAEKVFATTPGTLYNCVIGGGGGAGVAGGDTTFTVGGTTVTAKGGAVGASLTQTNATSMTVPGGAGGTVSTNGDLNGAGNPGGYGVRIPGTAALVANTFSSGFGGSSLYGGGGVASGTPGNGAAGAGFGGGGAGGLSNTAGANNGGAGSGGVIIIEEFS